MSISKTEQSQEKAQTVKPGYKTSEFWLNFLVFILGAALASGLIANGSMVSQMLGSALSLLSSLGYTLGRVGVKKADSASIAYSSKAANDNSLMAPNFEKGVTSSGNPTKESA